MKKLFKEDLKRSGISVADAKKGGMYFVLDASKICEDFNDSPAIIIPYLSPWTGEPIEYKKGNCFFEFVRVRYLGKTPPQNGFTKKKYLRYSQPKESGVHAYFPVVEGIDWVEILNDPTIPIILTEGEKKALKGCLAGFPTIGLGGVFNFTHDGELLAALDKILWGGRAVFICFDSDAALNARIRVAEGRLATELSMKRGADIFIVRLPESKSGNKVGLDDYIKQKGGDAFEKLLENSPPMRSIDKAVIALNDEVAWIEKDGLLLDLKTDIWIKKDNFKSGSEYSSRIIETYNPNTMKMKTTSVAKEWLTHPLARRYADTLFRPGTLDKTLPLPGGGVAYNRFRGLTGIPATKEDCKPFFDLLDHLMSRTDEFEPDLIWKIICWKIQNLGKSVNLGLMLLGDQGSGKSLFCDIIAGMVDPYNYTISSNMLGSDFNGWIETCLICIMHEAKESKMKFTQETLRTYITDPMQPCNEKYRPSRQVRNNAFFIFNSNQRKAGAFPDKDRRMIIVGCPDKHERGADFYEPIFEWFKKDGPKKLLYYFQNYDLKGSRPPHHAPDTREKRMAYHASLTPIQKVGDAMKNATENVVFTWMTSAMSWAGSEAVGSSPSQISLALEISSSMMHIQIRPFYTPEELKLLFPSIAGTLAYGKITESTSASVLTQELLQCGIDYLRCKDNFDGFMHNGVIKQYLVVSDHAKYKDPITQEEFDKLMKTFPTYGDARKTKKVEDRKAERKSQRNRK